MDTGKLRDNVKGSLTNLPIPLSIIMTMMTPIVETSFSTCGQVCVAC